MRLHLRPRWRVRRAPPRRARGSGRSSMVAMMTRSGAGRSRSPISASSAQWPTAMRASEPKQRSPTTTRTSMCSSGCTIRIRTASCACSDAATSGSPTDQIKIIIDSYHDRRTGYEFAVNPAGVKRDYSDVQRHHRGRLVGRRVGGEATVDSLGWTAEFRIPLSQLRYADTKTHTFGFGVWRDIDRFKERDSWPVYEQSDARFMSQLGTVEKIDGIPSPHAPGGLAVRGGQERLGGSGGGERSQQQAVSRREHQVRADVESHARRDREPGLRAGGIGSVGAQSVGVRDLLRGAAALLSRGHGDLQLSGQLQRSELQQRRALLLAAHRSRAAARLPLRQRDFPDLHDDPRRHQAHGPARERHCRSACSTRSLSARPGR